MVRISDLRSCGLNATHSLLAPSDGGHDSAPSGRGQVALTVPPRLRSRYFLILCSPCPLVPTRQRGAFTPGREEARQEVGALVDKYRQVLATGREKGFLEEDVKGKFIVPLLEALGWDVKGLDEVKFEQRTLVGRADFALRLPEERRPHLFLEIKTFELGPDGLDGHTFRGGKKLTFPQQAIQYAWQMQVPWAVLTNFKEIRLYSSYVNPERPREGLVFAVSWERYLDRFDDLWTLSKEAVASGALDAREITRRRETIHEEAPQDLFECRNVLAEDVHRNNPGLPALQVQEAVQRILDRLLVIRVAEDRLILPSETLWKRYNAWHETQIDESALFVRSLKELFRQFDSIYNSKLFAVHFCEDLQVSNRTLAEVLGILYEFNFDLIDADILGSIYEGYLGYVLTEVKGGVRFEKMEKARKRHGVYYTPTYVVEYIVDSTVGRALEGVTAKEAAGLRILDPAVGSGSFLIKAYDRLAAYFEQDRLAAMSKLRNGRTLTDFPEEHPDFIDRGKEILHENLYGVDLDEQAAELASVNLLLKAMRKGEKLPLILDENIRVGNSLVEGDEASLRPYFGDRWNEIEPFNWSREFRRIMESGGFDVVLGNPPYVNVMAIPAAERNYFLSGPYPLAYKRFDLYVLFIDRGLRLLKPGGRLAFIVPKVMLTSPYAVKLRTHLLETCALEEIVDLSPVKVFPHQSVQNIIFVVRKEADERVRMGNLVKLTTVARDADLRRGINGKVEQVPQRIFLSFPEHEFRLVLRKGELLSVAEKMESGTARLGDVYYVNWGLRTGTAEKTRAMIVRNPSAPNAKPLIRGENIVDRYLLQYAGDYILYDTKRLYNPMFPELFEKPKIVIRKITGRGLFASYDDSGYYGFSTIIAALPYASVASAPRARIPKGADQQPTSYDPLFILALLNSKAMRFYYRVRIGDDLCVVPGHVKRLPIPTADAETQRELRGKAEELLRLRRELAEEEPLVSMERVMAGMPRSFDDTLATYVGKLEDRDIEERGALAAVHRVDALSIRATIEGEWLEVHGTYRERGQAMDREGVLRYRLPEPLRTFLYTVLSALNGEELGRGRPIMKVRGVKVPRFDDDHDHNLAIVSDVVTRLRQHQARVRELRSHMAEVEREVDAQVYRLYGLAEGQVATIESQTTGSLQVQV